MLANCYKPVNSNLAVSRGSLLLFNAGMGIREIRKQRLGELREKLGSWAEIARRLGEDTDFANTLSQIHSGTRNMGEAIARKLDALADGPGSMDTVTGLAKGGNHNDAERMFLDFTRMPSDQQKIFLDLIQSMAGARQAIIRHLGTTQNLSDVAAQVRKSRKEEKGG